MIRSVIFTISFYTGVTLGALIGYLLPSWLRKAWLMRVFGFFDWAEKNILGLTYEVRGVVPDQPCLIAGGHQSMWECFKILWRYPHIKIVMKQELLDIPVVGASIRALEQIPLDRSGGAKTIRQLIKQTGKALKEGYCVLIFPQGTRVEPGQSRPYLGGIGVLYEWFKVPVVPMVLNSGMFWPRNSWKMKRPGTAVMEFLPPIEPGLSREELVTCLSAILQENERRLLAESTPGLLTDQDRLQLKYRQ